MHSAAAAPSKQRAGVQGSCSILTLPTPGPPDVTSIRAAACARRGRGKPVRRLSINAARGSAGPLTWGRRRPHSGKTPRLQSKRTSGGNYAVRQHHLHEPRAATAYFSPADGQPSPDGGRTRRKKRRAFNNSPRAFNNSPQLGRGHAPDRATTSSGAPAEEAAAHCQFRTVIEGVVDARVMPQPIYGPPKL